MAFPPSVPVPAPWRPPTTVAQARVDERDTCIAELREEAARWDSRLRDPAAPAYANGIRAAIATLEGGRATATASSSS